MRLPRTLLRWLPAALALGSGASFAAATGPAPRGVSPGDAATFALAAACPTFSWASVAGVHGYELVVYPVADETGKPSLEALLPAGASSWTPAADRCLATGRYAWSVRAVTETDRVGGEWAEALLFEVAEGPTAAEVQRALEVVQRYLGTARVGESMLGEAAADIPLTRAVAAAESPRAADKASETHDVPVGGGPATAVRGEVPELVGETYGVRGVSNSPDGAGVRADNNGSGADLVLGGSPVAALTESGLSRDSVSNLTFDFTNPGAGTMSLQVDGASVLTTATDDWVDETGDTMTGTLTLSPAAGNALVTAAGDLALHGAATVTKAGARFLWDDASPGNFAAGRSSLASNTTGAFNTAVGTAALDVNTSGSFNTAVGRDALGASTTGIANTAVGSLALYANTTGYGNAALGANALGANTTGLHNVALGRFALGANTTANNNTAVGAFALDANATGANNVALGRDALGANTTAGENTAVGAFALAANTTGIFNVALGRSALDSSTTGDNNTAVGAFALGGNTTGYNNVALGVNALAASTTARENTAVGAYALDTNATGGFNVALGADALTANTTAESNTAVGAGALYANTTGAENVALGRSALRANTTADDNTAVGANALFANTTGTTNVAVGGAALFNTTANDNTAAGHAALITNTTGARNVALGKRALDSNTTGSDNVAIGWYSGGNLTTGDNNIMIEASGLPGESDTIRIGNANHAQTFIRGIHGVTVAGGTGVFIKSDGQLGTSTSSRRFKEEVREVGEASEALLALRPVSFRYTEEAAGEGERPLEYGLIAEEVAEVFPELVVDDEQGRPETVRYHLLVPLLLNELQRQQQEIEALRERLGRLEGG